MSTLSATPYNVDWLLERLQAEARYLEAEGIRPPVVFVLTTRNAQDRHKVEDLLYRWALDKYGNVAMHAKVWPETQTPHSSTFRLNLGEYWFELLLMDLETPEPEPKNKKT